MFIKIFVLETSLDQHFFTEMLELDLPLDNVVVKHCPEH
jgi:hypothetical protein